MKATKLTIDLRIIIGILLVVIGGMFAVWKPWQGTTARTVDISGTGSIKAEPNTYVFSPMYQKKGSDRAAIQAELITQVNGVIARLKELGVAESDITLASSTYDNYYNDGTAEVTSNNLTISVENKELVQKVQDYLATTSPQGQISPYANFTTEKRKALEAEARLAALKDARSQAESTAKELGLKIGKVIKVGDQQSGGVYPLAYGEKMMPIDASASSGVPVLSGKQEISYTVAVTYELK